MRGRGGSKFGRIELVAGAGLLVLGGLSARLYALSVVRHADLRLEAERRSRRVEIEGARRGRILDREGRPLALDRPTRDVVLDLPAFDATLAFVGPLAQALRCTRSQALVALRAARQRAEALDAEERRFVLARVELERAERLRRRVRRIQGLRVEQDAEGAALVTDAELLRLRGRVVERLARMLDLREDELCGRIDERVAEIQRVEERNERLLEWSEPLELLEDAPFEVVARVSERGFELPGVEIVERFRRRYPFGETACHLTGFLGKPSRRERVRDLSAKRLIDAPGDPLDLRGGGVKELPEGVRLRDEQFGRSGLEARYDDLLRGRPGARVVVRDVRGEERELISDLEPRAGRDLELTIDVDQQQAAEKALDEAVARHGDERSGAAAVIFEIRSGEVLALASSPRFDANRLRQRTYYEGVRANPRTPQANRAMWALPPGSTWKILSCFAMCDPSREGSLPPDWTTVCQGAFDMRRPRRFRCEGVHGRIGMARSIQVSCNVFFFRAAEEVGLDPLAAWAERLGCGAPLGSGLPDAAGKPRGIVGERGGMVPHSTYKEERLRRQARSVSLWCERLHDAVRRDSLDLGTLSKTVARYNHAAAWYRLYDGDQVIKPGEVRNTIIGQGDVKATPLQVASIAALVAGEGRFTYPRLLKQAPQRPGSFDLDPDVLSRVQEGMRRVVTLGTASGRKIGLRELDVAGKTGTAERAGDRPNVAWFMGYYPASAPEVAFAVVVDRTKGHGGGVCGPVARALIEAYEKARDRQPQRGGR